MICIVLISTYKKETYTHEFKWMSLHANIKSKKKTKRSFAVAFRAAITTLFMFTWLIATFCYSYRTHATLGMCIFTLIIARNWVFHFFLQFRNNSEKNEKCAQPLLTYSPVVITLKFVFDERHFVKSSWTKNIVHADEWFLYAHFNVFSWCLKFFTCSEKCLFWYQANTYKTFLIITWIIYSCFNQIHLPSLN